MNPILDLMNKRSNSPFDAIKSMMNGIKSSGNPEAALQQLAGSNPQVRQAISLVQQSGGDPKRAFYELARQRGVNPQDVLNQLR